MTEIRPAVEAMCRAHYESTYPGVHSLNHQWEDVSEHARVQWAFWMTAAALALPDWIEAAGHQPHEVPGPAIAKRIREVIGVSNTK